MLIGLDLARDLVPVHDRELDTHEDEIGPLSCHSRGRAVRDVASGVA
jgi:hypothetical protein